MEFFDQLCKSLLFLFWVYSPLEAAVYGNLKNKETRWILQFHSSKFFVSLVNMGIIF